MIPTSPYWLDSPHAAAAPLSGDQECDVAVVGAGLCGASVVHALAAAGVRVGWLEAGTVSSGASGRNAGFLLQGTAERYSRAIGVMGRQRARAVHQISRENHTAMAQTATDLAIDCGYMRRGALQLAGSAEEESDLLESAQLLREDGFAAEVRQGNSLDAVYRDAGFRIGVHITDDGELDPARFVRGVSAAAVAKGVQLYEHSRVTSIGAGGPGDMALRTESGTLKSQVVVLCTNAYTGALSDWFADKVDPVRGQMLATAPAPPLFACPVYADHGFDYWRQDEFGRIVLGGWRNLDPNAERGTEEVLHPTIQTRMAEFLHRFPAMREVPVTHRWAGTMGFSRDGLPIVGPVPGLPGAFAAAGFTGHGFGFAWTCGQALAQLVLEGTSPVADLFTSRRFLA